MATESEERLVMTFVIIGLVVGLAVIVVGEYQLFTGLPSGRYPLLIFALPVVAGAVVAFVIAMSSLLFIWRSK